MRHPTDENFRDLAPFEQVLSVVDALRGEGGCPWDRAQTHQSMARFLLEETYEVLETLDEPDQGRMAEELGDLLFQVVFHARLGSEQRRFNIDDVCRSIVEKMIRRHPHVFSDQVSSTPQQVSQQWEESKRRERPPGTRSLMEGIPRSLPALLQSFRVQARVAEVGFEWPNLRAAMDKVKEELQEFEEALDSGGEERQEEELGDLLFALVSVARLAGIDPEQAGRRCTTRFVSRFRRLEARFGGDLTGVSADEMERAWSLLK